MNTIEKVKQWFIDRDSENGRVVGLMVLSSKRRIYKMKRLGIIIGAVFVIVVSAFVVQYGWNEIITTIVPVGKITVWQALGMDALLSFIWPVLSSKKESEEDYSYAVKSSISKIITCAFLIWLASLFI
ncbi:phage membrane protein [Streptococcus pneumoniae]|nr:phage membrane protein [Streptococcus pneumoniae]